MAPANSPRSRASSRKTTDFISIQRLDHALDHLLRVAEHPHGLVPVEQRVLEPGTMITLSAFAIRKAASSADPERTVFCSAPAATTPSAAPKPPNMTERNERFIARHMM